MHVACSQCGSTCQAPDGTPAGTLVNCPACKKWTKLPPAPHSPGQPCRATSEGNQPSFSQIDRKRLILVVVGTFVGLGTAILLIAFVLMPGTPRPSKIPADETVIETGNKRQAIPINVTVLHPSQAKVRQRGEIVRNPFTLNAFGGLPDYWFEVAEVLSDNEVLIRERFSPRMSIDPGSGAYSPQTPVSFIVEMPTAGLADNARIQLTGVMDVMGTKRIGRATVFVLRPAPRQMSTPY
jgi:hypothetical protein